MMASFSFHCFCIFFLLFNGGLVVPTRCFSHRAPNPTPRNALFVFGDSLYDVGMNNYINTTVAYLANFRPYGETFFNFPTGRFCDGRVIPDFIAEYANLPLIPPYLQPGNIHVETGVNFASGGGGALNETHRGYVVDLKTQLGYFKDVVRMLREKHGKSEAKALLGRAVYMISIGGNDYIDYYTNNYTLLQVPYSLDVFLDMVFGNFSDVIKVIYDEGGRKFGFTNLVPIGCLPQTRTLVPATRGACLKQLTDLSEAHNRVLPGFLMKLQTQLRGFRFSHFNAFHSFDQRINYPSKYGFDEGEAACCGSGPYRGIRSCGGKEQSEEYELCPNPSKYVFFDSYHGSEAVYKQLAKLWWDGSSKTTWPCKLKSLFSSKPGAGAFPNNKLKFTPINMAVSHFIGFQSKHMTQSSVLEAF